MTYLSTILTVYINRSVEYQCVDWLYGSAFITSVKPRLAEPSLSGSMTNSKDSLFTTPLSSGLDGPGSTEYEKLRSFVLKSHTVYLVKYGSNKVENRVE